jgi:hypothetical protein
VETTNFRFDPVGYNKQPWIDSHGPFYTDALLDLQKRRTLLGAPPLCPLTAETRVAAVTASPGSWPLSGRLLLPPVSGSWLTELETHAIVG